MVGIILASHGQFAEGISTIRFNDLWRTRKRQSRDFETK